MIVSLGSVRKLIENLYDQLQHNYVQSNSFSTCQQTPGTNKIEKNFIFKYHETIKYLGIKLTRNTLDLYEESQKVFLKTIKQQMGSFFYVLKMLVSQINLWISYRHN